MTALDEVLGTGPVVGCRRISDTLAAHFWAEPVRPGDPCLCGDRPYTAPAPIEDAAR